MRHFLEVDDLSPAELLDVLDRSEASDLGAPLAGKGVALYFEKPSLRTRHSSEMGVVQLGGHPVTIRRDEIGAGARESLSDIAHVLGGYHALMGARVFMHDDEPPCFLDRPGRSRLRSEPCAPRREPHWARLPV